MDVAESQAKINVGADRESFKAAGLADNRVPEGSRERMSPMLCAADETQLGGTIGFGRRLPIVGGAALDGVTPASAQRRRRRCFDEKSAIAGWVARQGRLGACRER